MTFWEQVVVNPRFWLSVGVLLTVTAIECLLALWTGAAPPKQRLLRVVIVWLAIVLLIPIRAHQPALFFAAVAVDLIILIGIIRFLTRERASGESLWSGWHRFSVADVCVLTLLAGTILGLGLRQQIPLYLLPMIFVGVFPLVLVIATSYYAVAGRHRLRAVVLLVATLIAYGPLQFGWNIPFLPLALRWPSSNRSQDMTLLGPLIFLAWLVTYLGPRVWASRHHLSPTWRRKLAVVGLGVSLAALGLTLWYFHGTVSWNVPAESWRLLRTLYHTLPLTSLAAVIAATTALGRALESTQSPTLRRGVFAVAACCAAIIAMPLAWIYWQMLATQPFPPSAFSTPTNYDRLAAIARQLQSDDRRRIRRTLPAGALPLVEEASQLLKTTNHIPVSALERESQWGTRKSAVNYYDMSSITDALQLAAADAQASEQHDVAADRALDLLRLGTMLQRGGTSSHAHMGCQIHSVAAYVLDSSARDLSAARNREIVRAIDSAIEQREEPAIQMVRERIYHDRIADWPSRFALAINGLAPQPMPAVETYQDASISYDLQLRNLQIRLAFVQFKRDRGQRPKSLVELVPEYLDQVPIDPHSGRPLLMVPLEYGFRTVYSVGRDGIDNGGEFTDDPAKYANETGYDLKLKVD